MNVTTSAHWSRAPVGVVRVEQSIAERLAVLYGNSFHTCVWDGQRFVEWHQDDKRPSKVSESGQDGVAKREPSELPPMFPVVPRREALALLAQSFFSLAPGALRPFLNRQLYRVRWRLKALLDTPQVMALRKKFVHAERRTFLENSPVVLSNGSDDRRESSLFQSGDVLISMGLDWDYPFFKAFYSLRKNLGVKVVTCCYDLIPVIYPQYCVGNVSNIFKSYFIEVADGSDLVLCISRQSERDLNAMLHDVGGARPLTHVFPLGDAVRSGEGGGGVPDEVRNVLKSPFILFVSTIERRKNHEVLYRAYHILAENGLAESLPKLVFVGMQGWGVGDLMKDIELDPLMNGFIVRLNHVSDAALSELYRSAMFCVFPSFYEGWGLPVGEALAAGKVVLCSNRGSLPEVGGGLVQYVDPWAPKDWADAIINLVQNPEKLRKQEDMVKASYRIRTWDDSAESVKEAVDKLFLN